MGTDCHHDTIDVVVTHMLGVVEGDRDHHAGNYHDKTDDIPGPWVISFFLFSSNTSDTGVVGLGGGGVKGCGDTTD